MISDFIAGAFCVVGGYTLALCVAELRKPAQTPHAECEKAPTLRRKYRDAPPEVAREPVPMPRCEPAKKPCVACYGGDLPCVCRHTSPVPQCQVAREVGGIDYKFMGMTGAEDQ